MEKIKVGIIGSGFAANLHVKAYQRCANAEVIAAAAIDNLENFCRQNKIPKGYDDYREMLKKEDIEMVSVCVPNYLHKEVVCDAANAGKHIVCEKPLATTLEDCDQMIETCQDNKVKLMYAEDWIFAPALIRAKNIYKEGAIGDIVYIKAKESHGGSHSLYAQKLKYCGGGAMIHLGIHPAGLVTWFKEKKVIEVLGKTSQGLNNNLIHAEFEGEDWAAGILTFEDNTFALIEGNYVTFGGMDNKIEVYGSKGNIKIELTHGSPILVYSPDGYEYAIEKADTTKGWTFPAVDEESSLGYQNEISHFVDCVKFNQEVMEGARGEDGRIALQIVFGIYESMKGGKPIKLNHKK
jgi:predicted dehydrogenase